MASFTIYSDGATDHGPQGLYSDYANAREYYSGTSSTGMDNHLVGFVGDEAGAQFFQAVLSFNTSAVSGTQTSAVLNVYGAKYSASAVPPLELRRRTYAAADGYRSGSGITGDPLQATFNLAGSNTGVRQSITLPTPVSVDNGTTYSYYLVAQRQKNAGGAANVYEYGYINGAAINGTSYDPYLFIKTTPPPAGGILDPARKGDGVALNAAGNTITYSGFNGGTAASYVSHNTGKWAFKATVNHSTLCGFGVVTPVADLFQWVARNVQSGGGFRSDDATYWPQNGGTGAPSPISGEVIFEVDLDLGTMWFRHAGTRWGPFSAQGVGGGTEAFAAVSVYGASDSVTVSLWNDGSWVQTPTAGFNPWMDAPAPPSTMFMMF